MPLTNFSSGLASMGVPILGSQGLMVPGNAFFVDAVKGNDSYPGTSMDLPLLTLAAAYAKTVDNNNDVIYYIGSSSGLSMAATLTWSKSYTHLVGLNAPVPTGQRSRIGHSANFSPMITLSGSGCIFNNLRFMYGRGGADNHILMTVSGGRNYFRNVDFANCLHATEASDTASNAVYLSGSENYFHKCTIGADTIARSALNASVLIAGASARNTFEDCHFQALTSATTPIFVGTESSTTGDRWHLFKDCLFSAMSVNNPPGTTKAMTAVFTVQTNHVTIDMLVQNSYMIGITGWSTDAATRAYVHYNVPGFVANAAASGIGLVATS